MPAHTAQGQIPVHLKSPPALPRGPLLSALLEGTGPGITQVGTVEDKCH